MLRATWVSLIVLGLCGAVSADTIVLKNGRRIVAAVVSEEGDKVSYETPAGRLTIPRSLVARIEHNELEPESARSADPPFAPPQIDFAEESSGIEGRVVRDGSLDHNYLAELENEAAGGAGSAMAKAAAGHRVAGQFLAAHGDLDGAIDHYRRALSYVPQQLALLLNLAELYLRESQFSAAMDPLDRARRVAPDSAEVAKLTGWAYYGSNRLEQAVAEWKRALSLRADAEVQQALAKAERDRAEEASYREGETAHFELKYNGAATPDLARGILRTLEEHYRELDSELDYSPSESIGVILYTDQAFADITRAPSWAGAINDGRLRIPVQGLSSVTPELYRVLKHELTHSFVTQKTRGRCPVWLQEGIAQWMEGRRSADVAAALVEDYERTHELPLAAMEGSWMGLSGEAASYAYAWSLAAVEGIVQRGGMGDIQRILDRIAGGSATEAALREVLHSDYSDLGEETVSYLRRTYVH